MDSSCDALITRLSEGNDLSVDQSKKVFNAIMSGELSENQMEVILLSLKEKGETVDELTGAAEVMREKALSIKAPTGALDTCGTGGDGANTYNISTAVALVVAACDVPVAKHGNKAVSSKSGSADVLQQLGLNLDAPLEVVEKSLHEVGFGFMMAPKYHAAMRHVAPVRKALGVRTIFNLLGPLSNPASADYQLLGVYSKEWLEPVARALHQLGTKRAWVVHGADGLDELTTTAESYVCKVDEHGKITPMTITPEELGLQRVTADELKGGDSKENARALKALLEGEKGAYRDIVLLNSAAALVVAGKATELKQAMMLAEKAIDEHKVLKKLDELVKITSIT